MWNRRLLIVVVAVASGAIAAAWPRLHGVRPAPVVSRDTTPGRVVVAATGDTAMIQPAPALASSPQLARVVDLIRQATVGFTNLEVDLTPASADPDGDPRWPHGTPESSRDLKAFGFTVVSQANNHAGDYGIEGLLATSRALDAAGVAHAGTGHNSDEARAPVYVTANGVTVALVAATASHAPVSRAAPSRGDIAGRPGVSPVRVTRRVVLDPVTFTSLRGSMGEGTGDAASADGALDLYGTPIIQGPKNRIDLVADHQDVRDLVDAVKRARQRADVVLVSLHAHEPGNAIDTPAAFLPELARALIDAGADLVIGHGPHQLRGIELYRDKLIFYSLGNFIFQCQSADPAAADIYEDPSYSLVLGARQRSGPPLALYDDRDVWWESAVAVVTIDHGALQSVRIYPIDLGLGAPLAERGTPRLAAPDIGRRIVERLNTLSAPFGTRVRLEGGAGVVDFAVATETR